MARATTIEERTEKFISAYNRLKTNGLLPDNETLAKELGYKSDASISEILGRRQNIPPAKWLLFVAKWPEAEIKQPIPSDTSEATPQYFTADQLFAMFLEVSKAQTAILHDIKKEMAREGTQATIANKLDNVLSRLDHQDQVEILGAMHRQTGFDEIKALLAGVRAQQTEPSLDESNRRGEIGEDGNKPRSRPKTGK